MRYIETIDVAVDDLAAFPGNARLHAEDVLQESAKLNGQYRSIIARRAPSGRLEILAGHGTRDAFAAIGNTTVRVEIIEASDDEAARIVLVDNRGNDLASYDESMLLDLLESVPDLTGTGYDDAFLESLVDAVSAGGSGADDDPAAVDDVPDVPKDPITRPGDVWTLGQHRVICGDCRDPDVVADLLAGATINLAVTSPPYADRRIYDASSGFLPIAPDAYVEWFAPVAANVAAHLADDGSWFVNIKPGVTPDGDDTELYVFDLVLAHVRSWGWHFATEFCWERVGVPKSVTRRFKNQFEPVYQFTRGGRWKMRPDEVRHASDSVPVNVGTGGGNTAWHGDQGNGGAFAGRKRKNGRRGGCETEHINWQPGELIAPGMAYPGNRLPSFTGTHTALGHTAAFPVGLPTFFTMAYTDPGDAVYDPFMGSGSTLIAAHETGRIAYGAEISPGYVDVIATRWQTLTGVMPVLESTGEPVDFGDG